MSLASKDLTINNKLYSIILENGTDFFLGRLLKNTKMVRIFSSDMVILDVLIFEHMPESNLLNSVNIFNGFNPGGIDPGTKMFSEARIQL